MVPVAAGMLKQISLTMYALRYERRYQNLHAYLGWILVHSVRDNSVLAGLPAVRELAGKG